MDAFSLGNGLQNSSDSENNEKSREGSLPTRIYSREEVLALLEMITKIPHCIIPEKAIWSLNEQLRQALKEVIP